jgi:ABC-type glycerol-3-phosphate transport system permease component
MTQHIALDVSPERLAERRGTDLVTPEQVSTRRPPRRVVRKSRLTVSRLLQYVVLGLWAVISLGPLVWMLVNSVKENADIFANPWGLAASPQWQNFPAAWEQGRLGQALLNSLVVSIGAVALGLVVSLLIGFALSKGRLPYKGVITIFFTLGLLIPSFSLLIPILMSFQGAGLISNLLGLVLVYSGLSISLGVLLFKNAFDAIPEDYLDAASMDGASVPRILISVLIPMVRPTISTFVVLTFLGAYNDYVFALVLNNNPDLRTLPIALLSYSGQYATQYNLIFAALAIVSIPPIIVYLFMHRQVQESLAAGGRTG